MSSGMENAQNFAAVVSSMVLGPSFFCHFSKFSHFLDFFNVFPNSGVGEGDVFLCFGVGGCFPMFLGVFSHILGLGGGVGASLIWPLGPVTGM